jgi:hypothetical protein
MERLTKICTVDLALFVENEKLNFDEPEFLPAVIGMRPGAKSERLIPPQRCATCNRTRSR